MNSIRPARRLITLFVGVAFVVGFHVAFYGNARANFEETKNAVDAHADDALERQVTLQRMIVQQDGLDSELETLQSRRQRLLQTPEMTEVWEEILTVFRQRSLPNPELQPTGDRENAVSETEIGLVRSERFSISFRCSFADLVALWRHWESLPYFFRVTRLSARSSRSERNVQVEASVELHRLLEEVGGRTP